jgi:hypothetical protein
MFCSWKSKPWPPNGFESSNQYYEAEEDASLHIEAHRRDEQRDADGTVAGEQVL